MSDHLRIQPKKTTTPPSTSLTVIPPTRGFTPQAHTVEPQAKTQAASINEVEPYNSKHETPDLQTQLERASHYGHSLSRMQAKINRPSVIQPKLTIGQPGDKYEHEADRVAEQVMRMPEPINHKSVQCQGIEEQEEVQMKPLATAITPLVQREAVVEEDKDLVQTKLLDAATTSSVQRKCAVCETEKEAVQMKPSLQKTAADGELQAGSNIENQISRSKGGGSSLPDEVRSFMKPRFGADFSNVRVHTDGAAVQMNRELGAQAFTHGSDIYYGGGKAPGINNLTAHELTHVVQQTDSSSSSIQCLLTEISSVSQRIQKDGQSEAERIRKLNEDYENAVTNKDWQKAAELLNAFNKDDILARLEKLKRGQVGAIYQGAIDNKLVGSESQVALLARAAYLDLNYENAVKGGNWKSAAEFLNGFNDTDIVLKLEKLNPSQLSLLKRGSLDGGYSRIAKQIQQEPAPALLSSMSASDKLVKAIKRSADFMGGELGKRIDELLTPQSIAMMMGFAALFIAAQATPAGWVADGLAVIGLVASAALIGFEVSEVINHIRAFIDTASNAATNADIDVAAKHFATAVTKVGVDVILAILLHKAGKAAKPYIKPPTGYVDMVTPEGKIIRVPQEALPENTSKMVGKGESKGKTPPTEQKSGSETSPEGTKQGNEAPVKDLKANQARFDNFRQTVDPKDIKGAPDVANSGTTGHARSKHGVSNQVQADILNKPDRIFSGKNKNGREVDIYYKDGSVVITEAGNKRSVITSYGKVDAKAKTPTAVDPSKWANDANYVEIKVNGPNQVIYPNLERWKLGDWP